MVSVFNFTVQTDKLPVQHKIGPFLPAQQPRDAEIFGPTCSKSGGNRSQNDENRWKIVFVFLWGNLKKLATFLQTESAQNPQILPPKNRWCKDSQLG